MAHVTKEHLLQILNDTFTKHKHTVYNVQTYCLSIVNNMFRFIYQQTMIMLIDYPPFENPIIGVLGKREVISHVERRERLVSHLSLLTYIHRVIRNTFI